MERLINGNVANQGRISMKRRAFLLATVLLFVVGSVFAGGALMRINKAFADVSPSISVNGTCNSVTATVSGIATNPENFLYIDVYNGGTFLAESSDVPYDNGATMSAAFATQPTGSTITVVLYDNFSDNSLLSVTYTCGSTGSQSCVTGDSRLNPVCLYPWETAAVYCLKDGSIQVYAVPQSVGTVAFTVTPSDLVNKGLTGKPSKNTQIASYSSPTYSWFNVQLYKLSSGTFQINATTKDGKGYVFQFPGCNSSAS
jgi:hypothetical protein